MSLRPSLSFSDSSTATCESSGRFRNAVQMAVTASNAVSLTNLHLAPSVLACHMVGTIAASEELL